MTAADKDIVDGVEVWLSWEWDAQHRPWHPLAGLHAYCLACGESLCPDGCFTIEQAATGARTRHIHGDKAGKH